MNNYFNEIRGRLLQWLKGKAQNLVVLTAIANLVGTAIYYIVQENRLGAVQAQENLLDNLLLLLSVNICFFVLYLPYVILWQIPRNLYEEQLLQIQQLADKLSPHKIAAEISVTYQNMPTSGINPLMAYIKNDNPQPITCFVVMTDFYRGGERYDNRYFPSPFLQWRDQANSGTAQKTIHAGMPPAQLSIATTTNNQELKLMLAQEPTRSFKGEYTYLINFEIRGTMNGIEFTPIQCSLTFSVKPSPTVKRRTILVMENTLPLAPVETKATGNH